MIEDKIKSAIRDVPDFPKKGIMFKDITPIFLNSYLCDEITEEFIKRFEGTKLDAVVGIESRGFLFGILIANKLNIPFVLIRKAGKLPYKTVSYEYELEYGTSKVEMHIDAIKSGWNVLIHDDLLATAGTATAGAELIKMQGGNVAGFAFLVELEFLKGKEKLKKYSDKIISLVRYE